MKIILENTDKIVKLEVPGGGTIDARLWQGETDSGVPVHAFVAVIVAEVEKSHPDHARLTRQFDEELRETVGPRAEVKAYDLRYFID